MKNKIPFIFLLGLFLFKQVISQSNDSISCYLNELVTSYKSECEKYSNKFFGVSLYVPQMFVDRQSRITYINPGEINDSLCNNSIKITCIDKLPDSISIANSDILWNGTRYAMFALPLPKAKEDIMELIAHESFHVIQYKLNLRPNTCSNIHLDDFEGKFWLQMEFRALFDAIKDTVNRDINIKNALIFRKYRHSLYPYADSFEQNLEILEGLANYTGWKFSNKTKDQLIEFLDNSINNLYTNMSLSRNFAYISGLLYGYLFDKACDNWYSEININSDFGFLIEKLYDVKIDRAQDLQTLANNCIKQYNGMEIYNKEKIYFKRRKKLANRLKNKLLYDNNIIATLEDPSFELRSNIILTIDTTGTAYNNIRVSDNWGILSTKAPGLLCNNKFYISINRLKKVDPNTYQGKGWKLILYDGYYLHKFNKSYMISKID